MEKKKIKIGLVPKLIIAIIVGILFGQFLPEGFCRFVVTLSGFFSTFLKFVIPLMILAYVTMGIADLSQGAGKLLLITVALAYGSTLIAGSASYLVSSSLFPHFMSEGALDQIAATADASLTPFFSITLEPVMDTLSAVALAFVMGLCLSSMRGKEMGNSLYNGMSDFSKIIDKVLHTIIIPLLPLYICGTFTDMTEDLGGAKIYLKREDLNHTGAHKINNVLGQVLLAKKMGKTRVIAETGAGQHGVATATAAALMGMECEVFMGKEDTERQALNVYKMRLLGAKVHAVTSGTATLKDAVSETMREWTNRIADTHYVLGSVMGPHPFPTIVRDFQAVISKEIKEQMLEKEGRLPDVVLACVGGGSNAIGTFYNFIEDKDVRLIGCEAAGRGVNTAETAATIATGRLGIFHGMKSYFCQDEYGQIAPVYSISAGLDYPGVGPEHAHLYDIGRAEYVPVTDDEAVEAFEYLSRTEGIIPAIESAHAVAYAKKIAPTLGKDKIMVVTISGRGDKDCAAIARYRGEDIHE